jgi:D,D-heptose 1,7-bisphosphate phosphatase
MIRTAVIVAGGQGTRLEKSLKGQPKALAKIDDIPILEHQLNWCGRNGVDRVYILLGYLSEQFGSFLCRTWDIEISTITEQAPLGTGGCLASLKGVLKDDFILLFGDIYLDISLEAWCRELNERPSSLSLLVHPNDHPSDSDLVEVNDDEIVIGFHRKPNHEGKLMRNCANSGVAILGCQVLDYIKNEKSDFFHDIVPRLLDADMRVTAYKSSEYLKDCGTPERLADVNRAVKEGIPAKRNLDTPQRAVFIDRDGTLNVEKGFMNDPLQMQLIPGAGEAIRALNDALYLVIVITNQSVIARGLCSHKELSRIHGKLDQLLSEKNAYLDDICFCPHHPDSGYPEEIKQYKRHCGCRKPGAELVLNAIRKFNIDINSSFVVGDRTCDIELGNRMGITSILVRTGAAGEDGHYKATADFTCDSLSEAVGIILEN